MSRHSRSADHVASRSRQTEAFARSPVSVAVAVALLSFSPGWMSSAGASPTGGQVAAGTATIQQPTPQSTIVHQATPRAVLNWQGFGIGAGESVIFRQPSSSAVALNRVVGPDASVISGTLQANGHVFLLNPSGVLFSKGASVDVGGLVASTLAISNNDFMAGRYVFSGGAGSGAVVNEGSIRAADGGYVALIGNQVSNSGTIVANKGSVALGAGDTMLLDFAGDGLLNLKVNTAAAAARIDSGGLIQADGGRVVMSAQAKNALTATALNVDGVVRARGLGQRNGEIFLDGGRSGVTQVSGTLDASSAIAGQKGGEIRVLGEYVGLFANALLDASGAAGGGTILLGGDFQGRNPEIANAFRTYIGPDATIRADASASGDGGKVIVWADDWTKFYGKISARGGATGGHGGFAEVSGKGNLLFAGLVDLTALFGTTGTLLLDPRDITVQTAGTSDLLLTGDDQVLFNEPDNATDITLTGSVLATQLETANVTLQANRDITFNDVAIAPASGTGSLTLRAGRSIAVNQDITLLGAFTATANDPGADATARGTGAAEFTMTAGRTISTATNNANITITTSTGPGGGAPGTGARESGSITLAGLNAGTGHVLVANNGATAGSNIMRADGAQLITASSAALDVVTAVGGSIGLGAEPIRLTVANVEARGESGGVFLASTGGVNIGGATLGALNGILTAPGGSILFTAAGSITTSEQLVAGAGGNVTLTATGAGSNVTTNAGVVSGFGSIRLQADNDVTINQPVGALTVGGITIQADNDGSGGGSVTTGAAGTIGNAGAGAILIEGVDVTLGAAVTGSSVRLRPTTAAATIGVNDATKNFNVSNAEIGQVTTTGTLTIGATSNTGGLTVGTDGAVNAGAKNVELITAATLAVNANGITTTGNLTFTANAMTLAGAAGTISGANVTLRPVTAGNTIGVEDNAQALSLSDAELDSIATAGILTIGSGAAGNISIGVDNPLTQDAKNFQFTTAGNIAIGGNTFTTTGNIGLTADNAGNTAAITTGAGIIAANTLAATADAGISLNTSATTLTATNSTSGNIVIAEATGLDLAGLTTSGAIIANYAGTVTLTAGGAGSTLTVSNPITSGSGVVQLTAVDGVTLNGATGDVSTTGSYTVIADSNTDATGTYTQNNAGSAVSSGAVQITAADVALMGTIAGGVADVTFLTSTAAATIGIEDATKNLNLTNPELSNVSTTGTIIAGSVGNTGGITIGTDAALAQGAKNFQFTTAGNIAIGANNFATTGNVGLTADNAGNIAAISSGAGVIGAAAVTAVADAGIGLNTSAATVSATNTTSGAVTIADADAVSVSGSNTGGGAFNVTAGGGGNTLTGNAGNVNANTGSVTLQADEMMLTGTVTGNGGVTLRPNTAGTPITLGAGTAGLDFTNTILQQVFTTGVLTIGSESAPAAGSITIDGPIAGGTNWTTLSLRTGAAVVDGNAAAGPDITVGNGVTQGNLAIRAAAGIGSAGDVLETSGGGNANGLNLAYSNPGAGGVSIANTGRLNIAAVDGLTASNGGTGATTLSSSSPMTIAADVIQVGSIDMTAGEDPGAIPGDDLTVNTGVTVRSTGGDVTLRAGDQVALAGTALVESTAAAGSVALSSGFNDNDAVGAITGTGRASAPTVVLDSLSGVGAAGARFNTTAGTLAARSRASGGVFVNEADAVTLNIIGAVVNAGAASGYDLLAAGAISVAGPVTTAAAGPLILNGTSVNLGANLTSAGGTIAITGPVTLTANGVTVDSTNGGTVPGGANVALPGAIDADAAANNRTLTVNSGAGTTTFSGNVGAAQSLADLDVAADAIVFDAASAQTVAVSAGGGNTATLTGPVILAQSLTVSGGPNGVNFTGLIDGAFALTVNAAGTTTFAGALGSATPLTALSTDAPGTTAINGGAVTTAGAQTYNDAVVLGADTTFTSSGGGDIAFAGSVSGGFGLTGVTSGTMTFGGIAAGPTVLASLTTDAGGSTVVIGGGITTTGAQVYNDPVMLGSDTALLSTGAGDIRFNNTLDGGFALALNTAGATIFGMPVGGATPLAALTTNAGGSTLMSGGSIVTTGAQTYNDAVTLGVNTTLASTGGGALAFANTLDGGFALVANSGGVTTFSDVVGGANSLASLATDAAGTTAITGGSITTTGAQVFNDPVTLGANAVLTSTGALGALTLQSTVDGPFSLTANTFGTTTFGGVIGGMAPLASLTINAPGLTVISGGAITTTGAQIFNNAATLGTDTTLTSTGGGAITFASTVDGAFAIVVNTGGATIFGGMVGAAAPLVSLTTDGPGTTAINGGAVTTIGAQAYNDPVTLGAEGRLTSTGAGDITFGGTLDGDAPLGVSTAGVTRFGGAVGGVTPLASVGTDAAGSTVIDGGIVRTTRSQAYFDPVRLGADTVLTAIGGPAIDSTIEFRSTIESQGVPRSLIVNSTLSPFGGEVGGNGNPLLSLTTDAPGITVVGSSVTTTGAQTYNDPVSLTGDPHVLTSTAGGAITLNGSVNGAAPLTINTGGVTTLNGAIGTPFGALVSLTTDAAGSLVVNGGIVNTTGAQTFNDPVFLGADTTFTSSGGGNIVFSGTLQSPTTTRALTVNTAGATTFGGPVGGGGSPLASIVTDAAGTTAINGGSVTTTGAQTHNDPVTLGANATLASTGGGALMFASTVNGPFALTASTAGATTFGGAVGTTAPLTSLTTDATGATALNGGAVTTTGNQTYNDAVTLGANPTLTSTSGNVEFANTIDADAAANNRALTVNASAGTVTFSGNVGASQALADLDVTAGPTTIVFNGAPSQTVNVSAQGGNTATFNGPVILATNLTVTSDGATDNNVSFGGPVDADTFANNRTLTVNSGTANTTFGAAVGSTQELGALSISAGQVALGGNVSVSGGGAVELSNVTSVAFSSGTTIDTDRAGGTTAAGDVRFNAASFTNTNAVAATFAIDASADNGAAAGDVALGTVGNANRLDQLAVLGDAVTFSGPVSARQVTVTANSVVTPTGQIRATQPFDNNASDANAALLLRGLSGPGQFGTRDAPIQIDAPGLFVVIPNMPNSLPFVFLAGDPDKSPVYQFANDPTHRRVFYNGAAPDSPADRAAQGAITQQLRTLLDELAIAGFAKENIRKQLLQGIVLETGLARPGIDEFAGEGVTGPASCQPDPAKAATGALVC